MTRGKLKFDWSVYSARRKVTLKMLMDKGLARDYESYVSYCNEMSVIAMPKDKYTAEAEQISPTVDVNHLSVPTPAAEVEVVDNPVIEPEPGLEATVWFAGVVDDAPSTDTPVAPAVSQTSKKKKQKEASSDSKE